MQVGAAVAARVEPVLQFLNVEMHFLRWLKVVLWDLFPSFLESLCELRQLLVGRPTLLRFRETWGSTQQSFMVLR